MRRFRWLLVCCLLLTSSRALALDFFGDLLYWQATEPVDWAMNTNRSALDQFVAFKTVDYDFNTGFRVGVGLDRDWGAKLYYTRFYTDAEDSVAGNVTPVFFGGRLATPNLLIRPISKAEESVPRSTTMSSTWISASRSVRPSLCNCGRCSA